MPDADGENSEAFNLYYPQVQHQMLVTGASHGWLVFYRDGQLREFFHENPDGDFHARRSIGFEGDTVFGARDSRLRTLDGRQGISQDELETYRKPGHEGCKITPVAA